MPISSEEGAILLKLVKLSPGLWIELGNEATCYLATVMNLAPSYGAQVLSIDPRFGDPAYYAQYLKRMKTDGIKVLDRQGEPLTGALEISLKVDSTPGTVIPVASKSYEILPYLKFNSIAGCLIGGDLSPPFPMLNTLLLIRSSTHALVSGDRTVVRPQRPRLIVYPDFNLGTVQAAMLLAQRHSAYLGHKFITKQALGIACVDTTTFNKVREIEHKPTAAAPKLDWNDTQLYAKWMAETEILLSQLIQ